MGERDLLEQRRDPQAETARRCEPDQAMPFAASTRDVPCTHQDRVGSGRGQDEEGLGVGGMRFVQRREEPESREQGGEYTGEIPTEPTC